MAKFCEVCGRYSDRFTTDKALLDHMVAVHPSDQRTQDMVKPHRLPTYGSTIVGKTRPTDEPQKG